MYASILMVSLLLQIAAAILALRLIRSTGHAVAWVCLAGAILLMAVRRSITLYLAVTDGVNPQLQVELLALIISFLMVVAVASIGPMIRIVSKVDEVERLAREVAHSEARFRGVIDQTFQFVGLMKLDGTLIDANRSSLAAAGVDAKDVIDCLFWETPWWTHSPALQQRLREAIQRAAAGELDRFPATHRAPDGSLIHVDFSLKPLRDENGEIIYLIPEGRDVTELRKEQARLRRANTKLKIANKELDEFAYVASHDLKSPLRAIENLAGWVLQDAGDALPVESAKHLTEIRARIRRMDALLQDLLEYSRAGRRHGSTSRVELSELIEEIRALLSVPAGFTITEAKDLPSLETYKTPLATCLRNLIDNAVKHHDRADGTVRIDAVCTDDYVDLIVSDDGPGIDPKFHERIFQIFQTLQSRGDAASTGVGLAHVKKIANSYGGDVWVDSAVGEGARFTLRWPLRIETFDQETNLNRA